MIQMLGVFFGITFSFASIPSNEGWEKFDEYGGITMFRKEIEGSSILAYRGTGVLDASIGKLVTVILDTPRKPQWMSRVKVAEVLRAISPNERIEYVAVKTPWPLKNRDFVYRVKSEAKPETREIIIRYESVEDPLRPENPDHVRAHIQETAFVLMPAEDGKKTLIKADAHADPRGSIPKWIVNIFQKRMPRESIEGMMRQVTKPGIEEHLLAKSLAGS